MLALMSSQVLILTIVSILLGALLIFMIRSSRRIAPINIRLNALEAAREQRESEIHILGEAVCELLAAGGVKPSRCTSQHGEELFLWRYCDWKPHGLYVEIGAYDGMTFSNSYFFEQIGWTGLLVEAHPQLVEECRSARPGSKVVHAALGVEDGTSVQFSMVHGKQGMDTLSFAFTSDAHRARIARRGGSIETTRVPGMRLDSLLERYGDTHIDWMSIDFEGGELDVLQGLDLSRCRPDVLMVEDNSRGGDHAIHDYLVSHGYQLTLRIACNAIYRSAGIVA